MLPSFDGCNAGPRYGAHRFVSGDTRSPATTAYVWYNLSPMARDDDLRAGRNPVHSATFAVLFVVMVVGVPFVLGGLVGLLVAPLLGGGLWASYRATLPRPPEQPSIAQTAGTTPCPACGSLQTDRRRFPMAGQLPWQCFSCNHEW